MVDQMFKHAIEEINAGKEKMEFWSGVGTKFYIRWSVRKAKT